MGPRPGEMDVGDASDEDTGAGDGGDRREHITCIWVYRIYIYIIVLVNFTPWTVDHIYSSLVLNVVLCSAYWIFALDNKLS
jgi:hypothetical protein